MGMRLHSVSRRQDRARVAAGLLTSHSVIGMWVKVGGPTGGEMTRGGNVRERLRHPPWHDVRMEGRALNREPRKQWAWLVPWFSGGIASLIGSATHADRAPFLLTGLAAGSVWQLLFRRDLTARLTFMAVLVTIGVLATLVAREEFVWQDMDTGGLLAIGILLGLIYTEQ